MSEKNQSKDQHSRRDKYYIKVFEETLSAYQELSSSLGTVPCVSFFSTNSELQEFPVVCDFVCDFELVVEQVLQTPANIEKFNEDYLDREPPIERADQSVEIAIGKALKKQRIYPLDKYMR